jgi:hypothetical protein
VTLGHEALLTLARKADAAARDGDRVRLEAATARLLDALLAHVGAERVDVDHLAGTARRKLALGQRHLAELLEELETAAQSRDGSECACVTLTERLSAELRLQADDERLAGVAAPTGHEEDR